MKTLTLIRRALIGPILAAVADSGRAGRGAPCASPAEVRETCKALTLEGRLRATSIGATVVYQAPVSPTDFVDPEVAERGTRHPEAALHEHLAQQEAGRRHRRGPRDRRSPENARSVGIVAHGRR